MHDKYSLPFISVDNWTSAFCINQNWMQLERTPIAGKCERGLVLCEGVSPFLWLELWARELENSSLQTWLVIPAQPSRLPPALASCSQYLEAAHIWSLIKTCFVGPVSYSLSFACSSSAVLNSLDLLEETWRVLSQLQQWLKISSTGRRLSKKIDTQGGIFGLLRTAFCGGEQKRYCSMFNSSAWGCIKDGKKATHSILVNRPLPARTLFLVMAYTICDNGF